MKQKILIYLCMNAIFSKTISLVELWLDLELNATLANFIAFESKFNEE